MKTETLEQFLARGGKIQTLPKAPRWKTERTEVRDPKAFVLRGKAGAEVRVRG